MKHKRLWSRILVAALVMMIIVPVTTLKAQAKTRSSYYYKWSKDWSEVTAILYEVNFDDYPPYDMKSVNADVMETVNTVISNDEDGKLVYTAHFTNSAFTDQTRTCRSSDDVVISWNFDSDPISDGWTCDTEDYAWWSESDGTIYYKRNVSAAALTPILGAQINSPTITLPENAILTFWLSGGADTDSSTGDVIVRCSGKEVDKQHIEGRLPEMVASPITHYSIENYWQYQVDLSEYAGKEVTLSFDFNPDGVYFDARIDDVEIHGNIPTGWQQNSDGKIQYFDENGTPVTGWQEIDDKWYYFDKSGIMQTGWQQIGKKWYFFNSSGIMQTGWKKSSGKWYYLNPANGQMVTGWKQISNKWYYFKTSGIMAAKEYCKGYWLNADGTWTYKPKASWKKNSKGWWYGDTAGWYAKNQTLTIDDKSYTFDKAGYCTNP